MTTRNPESSIRSTARASERIRRLESQLERYETAVICSLCTMLDLRDLETGTHATRLAEWAVRVGQRLGLSEEVLKDVEMASLLHDIGKVGVPDDVLNKPGKLSAEEWALVKKHPEFGWAILRGLPGLERVSLFVLHHHERMDGKGYPSRLAGEDIPIGSRIVAVVDAFDAMVSDRSYRKGLGLEEALARLRENGGTQFDTRIIELFGQLSAELPEVARIFEPERRGVA